ncbi:ABC transporter ATP-binding protein [Piscinibacter sakaiensis]|uniref:ABC transporter ATP-binding protein n=1 Tax=Piscinibacter sakaiensis TaxID=1547922 RepID=UPI003AAE7685
MRPQADTAAAAGGGSGSVRLEGVVKRHGPTTVLHGVDLEIRPGEFFVLLGPSGSGKTTTLRILAGLETVSEGRVLMDGDDVTAKEPGERDVAMVFQSYALYPHMTVAQNIGFPLKMVGTPADEIERAVADAAAKVDIGHLLARTPGQLSGGQQQRCALARAIVRHPKLFLLDEPLSNLDAKLRLETRLELHRLQRSLGATTVYVTHDQEEAMTLADRVAVFIEGRIVQIGSPREIYSKPKTMAVAAFIGTPPMNLLPGKLQSGSVRIGDALLPVAAPQASDAAPRDVMLGVRPGDLRIVAAGGLPAKVERIEDLGDSSIVSFIAGERLLKLKSDRLPPVREGDAVQLGFEPGAAHLFDPTSGARL